MSRRNTRQDTELFLHRHVLAGVVRFVLQPGHPRPTHPHLIGTRFCLPGDFLTLSAATFLRYVYIKPATIPVRALQAVLRNPWLTYILTRETPIDP